MEAAFPEPCVLTSEPTSETVPEQSRVSTGTSKTVAREEEGGSEWVGRVTERAKNSS